MLALDSQFSGSGLYIRSYLFLLADRVDRDFLGIRFFLLLPVLHWDLVCQEVQEALEGLGCCCGNFRWGSGSVMCWRDPFDLQQRMRRRSVRTNKWRRVQCQRRKDTHRWRAVHTLVWRWIASCSEERSRPVKQNIHEQHSSDVFRSEPRWISSASCFWLHTSERRGKYLTEKFS